MTETQSAFQELLQTTGKYPEALPQVPLHGFLTAVALGPDMAEEDRILATVYGCPVNESSDDFITLEQLVWDVVEEFIDDLDAQPFEPLLQLEAGHPPNPALWVEGFNKAVMLDEPAWSALNDEHLSAGKLYAFIQSLASPDLAETLFGIPVSEYDAYLAESIPMLPNALETLFRAYLEEGPDYPLDDPDGNYALNEDDLPRFSPEQLQQQTDEQLLGKILILGDMLPREVVDEAIRRGPPMARLLRRHLEDPANWHEDADLGAWWGLLHAVFILGHVTGEDAVKGLLHTVGQIRSDDDSALWEWLGGYLPVLFSNKREQAREGLRQIAFNKELDWKTRITALECLLEGAHAAGQQALDELLGEAARMAADEQEDWDIRLTTALHLLNFPRDAHRAVLEQLAQEQLEKERFLYYSLEDVQKAYRNGKDVPEWERFTAPLSFYDPQTILERQHRWLKKDQEQKDSDWLEDNDWLEEVDDLPYLLDDEMDTPYVRETAKVGRNEPCPCGSGKKYKKCCLNKLH